MSFLWPSKGDFAYAVPSGSSVNIFDVLEVSYASTWSALNFTLFCQIGDVSTDYGVWQAPSNPMAASGTYRLNSIYTAGFDIVKFPTKCAFRITEYGNSSDYNAGQFFQVVSNPGTSTTYQPTSTSTPSSTSQSSQNSGSITSSTSTPTPQTTGPNPSSSPSVTATSSSVASSTTATTTVAQQAALSAGAKAGIGVGAAIAVLVIAALCFFIVRLRRKVNKPMSGEPIVFKTEAPAYINLESRKIGHMYNMQEMEETSLVELPNQQRSHGPRELP